MVREDRIEVVTQSEIDRLPVRVPMIEIRTIGAGGGSIARLRAASQVTVGPESAGARPGPVCYGRGGTEPTVTDANLLLGRLDPAFFLGGAMGLDVEGARKAMRERIAEPLGLTVEAAAAGVLRITDTRLAAAIRVSLFEKGLDPRDFTLLSFGGAGSVHACSVAEELAIRRIVFPLDASTLSACGILEADIAHAYARSGVRAFDGSALPVIAAMAGEMQREAEARLGDDGIPAASHALGLSIDLRYKGQAFELTVPWDVGGKAEGFDAAALARVAERFHCEHEQRFSYANRDDVVEMVTLRLDAIGKLSRPGGSGTEPETSDLAPTRRKVFIGDSWHEVPVWRRDAIGRDTVITGPAIVEEAYTTVFIAPGWTLRRAIRGHLMADHSGARA